MVVTNTPIWEEVVCSQLCHCGWHVGALLTSQAGRCGWVYYLLETMGTSQLQREKPCLLALSRSKTVFSVLS